MTHPVLLSRVTIDADNNTLIFTEEAGDLTATVASGVYVLRGDGAADDLCAAVADALDTAGANTYAVNVQFSTSSSSPTGAVAIGATGALDFRIKFGDVGTTFDPALLGFTAVDTAEDATEKASTLSPSCIWVSPQPLAVDDEETDDEAAVFVANSGRSRITNVADEERWRTLGFGTVSSSRTQTRFNAADPCAAFERFLSRLKRGHVVELYDGAPDGSGAIDPGDLTADGVWVLDEQSATRWKPQRLRPGVPLYSWQTVLRGYVA